MDLWIVHIILIFIALLIFNYFLPIGIVYYYLYQNKRTSPVEKKIQSRKASSQAIRHEIFWSVVSTFIHALLTYGVIRLAMAGYTKIYLPWGQYGYVYLALSGILLIFMHDTYFYFTHRLMHHKSTFKTVHLTHHKSVTPTPWAVLSFSPYECLINALFPFGIVFLIPLHPLSIFIFLTWNFVINTVGHFGFELLPVEKFRRSRVLMLLNYTAHHDVHHRYANANFSLYFNLWDSIFKTNYIDIVGKPPPDDTIEGRIKRVSNTQPSG